MTQLLDSVGGYFGSDIFGLRERRGEEKAEEGTTIDRLRQILDHHEPAEATAEDEGPLEPQQTLTTEPDLDANRGSLWLGGTAATQALPTPVADAPGPLALRRAGTDGEASPPADGGGESAGDAIASVLAPEAPAEVEEAATVAVDEHPTGVFEAPSALIEAATPASEGVASGDMVAPPAETPEPASEPPRSAPEPAATTQEATSPEAASSDPSSDSMSAFLSSGGDADGSGPDLDLGLDVASVQAFQEAVSEARQAAETQLTTVVDRIRAAAAAEREAEVARVTEQAIERQEQAVAEARAMFEAESSRERDELVEQHAAAIEQLKLEAEQERADAVVAARDRATQEHVTELAEARASIDSAKEQAAADAQVAAQLACARARKSLEREHAEQLAQARAAVVQSFEDLAARFAADVETA